MKTIFLSFLTIGLFACCSQKMQKNSETTGTTSNTGKGQDLPKCVQNLINDFQKEVVQNPPRKIYSYTYQGNTVYYVPPICCDFYSDLYDSKCNLLAHPDGGFTGRGDGKIKNFREQATNEVLVWEDTRTFK